MTVRRASRPSRLGDPGTADPGRHQSRWLALAGFLVVTFTAPLVGVLLSDTGESDWYRALEKPSWNPPSSVFGPVWTTLYGLMAVAGWLAWRRRRSPFVVAIYAVQLALNGLWTPLFFAAHNPGAALIDIVAMLAAIVATMVAFFRQSKLAAILLAPYLGWVAFATTLNGWIWWHN